jgi:outer membrane protein TolC
MKLFRMIVLLLAFAVSAGKVFALTLDEAIVLGRARSLQMQDPRIDRERINGQVVEAWSNALPQVDGTAAYQRTWKSPVIFFPDFSNPGRVQAIKTQQDNSALGEVTLNQPLYTFGRVSAALKAAYSGKRSNDHLADNTRRTVDLNVARSYWTVLLLNDVLDARRASLAISDSSLARVKRMRDVGLMSDYDVLRAQVQAANQVPPLQQAENSLQLSKLALKDLLGVPLDTALTIEGSLDSYVASAQFDTSGANVLGRDDLEALRDLANLQKNLYVVQKAMRWPVLAGQFTYQWQWSNNMWAMNGQNNASSVYGGLALSIPIWSSGKVSGRAQQARADWRQASLNLEKAERGARVQYESSARTFRAAEASEDAARVAVDQAAEARRIAQTKLAQGQITLLEMDAAQLDELVARVALAQAHYDRLVAAAEARMAAGLAPYAH